MNPDSLPAGKHAGLVVALPGLGRVTLIQALVINPDTALYQTDHAGVLVKVFDLDCGRADELSYGPFTNYQAELATFEEIRAVESLRPHVPGWFGGDIDYDRKFAFIAMEFLPGHNLRSWAEEIASVGYEPARLDELCRAVIQTFSLMERFHRHGMLIIDFKPDNVIRLPDGSVRFVDLGAFFTPRHRRDLRSFAYAATPDHAEVVIDVSNLQAQVPPTVASDVFSAGVGLFEMATGRSRLAIAPDTADQMLAEPAMYRFRDSQIADVWKAFPHLKPTLPLVATQLRERRLLFAEFWHLLKAYVAAQVPDWETLSEAERGNILLTTGATFIQEQLPSPLSWLAGVIARATVLRRLRVPGMEALIPLLGNPASEPARADLENHNRFLAHLRGLDLPTDFARRLNTWDVRPDPASGHWAIAAPAACWHFQDTANFLHLTRSHADGEGHSYWRAVDELEADTSPAGRRHLGQLKNDHQAWLI
jgi:serine/threonine protein kinase